MWDLWWSKWHWGQVFLRVLGCPLPILIPTNAPYSSIIRDRYNRPVSGRRTKRTQPDPIPRNCNKEFSTYEQFKGAVQVLIREGERHHEESSRTEGTFNAPEVSAAAYYSYHFLCEGQSRVKEIFTRTVIRLCQHEMMDSGRVQCHC
jgi:hypothetical protein